MIRKHSQLRLRFSLHPAGETNTIQKLTRTGKLCEEMSVSKKIMADLMLAAGGKGVSASGVAEVAPTMISPTGTGRRKRKGGVCRGYKGTLIRRYHFRASRHQKLIIEAKLSTVSFSGFFPIGIPTRETETVVGSSGERTFTTL